jgi:hypothetical protein
MRKDSAIGQHKVAAGVELIVGGAGLAVNCHPIGPFARRTRPARSH